MGESNTVVSAYTTFRYFKHYCSHPSIYGLQHAKRGHSDICLKCCLDQAVQFAQGNLQQYFPFYVIFSSTGRRPASLCHGLLSVVRPSVRQSVRASVRQSVR